MSQFCVLSAGRRRDYDTAWISTVRKAQTGQCLLDDHPSRARRRFQPGYAGIRAIAFDAVFEVQRELARERWS